MSAAQLQLPGIETAPHRLIVRGRDLLLTNALRRGVLSADEIEALERPTEIERQRYAAAAILLQEDRACRAADNRGRARLGLPLLEWL